MPLPRQVRVLLALLALPVALHAFVADVIWMVPLAFVAGLLIAPSFAIFSMLVSQHAPARHATEAFTWLTTGIVAGIGAGMAAGGWLIELRGPAFAFAASAICILGGALVALAVRAPDTTGSELRT
jgi:predicted MFS family arabinose efflux permease